MSKLIAYNFVTLNGYFKGPGEDISWAKGGSKEEQEFAAENLKQDNILVFGRKTYEMMAGYWPTANAKKNDPIVAAGMNNAGKIVFSKTLNKAEWNNTRVVKNNIEEEIKKLKKQPGKDITILGSGSIVTQLTDAGLIDEYQLMLHPVVIADGTPLLKDIQKTPELKLTSSRVFKSGTVLLCYERVKK